MIWAIDSAAAHFADGRHSRLHVPGATVLADRPESATSVASVVVSQPGRPWPEPWLELGPPDPTAARLGAYAQKIESIARIAEQAEEWGRKPRDAERHKSQLTLNPLRAPQKDL
jgi:hypothetical protein